MMKKILTMLIAGTLFFGMTACGSDSTSSEITDEEVISVENNSSEEDMEETTEENITEEKTLVVYFSATGTTKDIAEKIAKITNADIYEIKAAQEYTSEDLNWHDDNSRTTHEQNDPDFRTEIGSDPISLKGYSTIYIGHPIWWGEEPRIMDTFVESYNFDGITMIPFCTSGSSGIGNSGKNMEKNAGSGTWLDGKRFGSGATEEEIQSWIDGLQ